MQPAVDLGVHGAGIAVTDNDGLTREAGRFHEMQQRHPTAAEQDEDQRQHERRMLLAIVVLHPNREAGDCGPQAPAVEDMSGVLIPIRQVEWHLRPRPPACQGRLSPQSPAVPDPVIVFHLVAQGGKRDVHPVGQVAMTVIGHDVGLQRQFDEFAI